MFPLSLSHPVPALPFAWLGASEEEGAADSGDQEWMGCPSPVSLLSVLSSVNPSRWMGPVRLSSHPKTIFMTAATGMLQEAT